MDDTGGNLIIVSGMSGAGRSSVADVLEDLGWFVVDNLPPMFLTTLVEQVIGTGAAPRLRVVVHLRTGLFFDELSSAIHDLRLKGYRPLTLFLEASDDVIVRRQESVRRPHPLQGEGRLLDGIQRERELLGDIRAGADLVIDTSSLNIHQLAAKIVNAFGDEENAELRATVVSFGFKYGIPVDADVVADMRFIPNPYWQPDLRPMTGQDKPVSDFVLGHPLAQQFLQNYVDVLDTLRTGYLNEGKRFVTVAVGCTGGKHRSVAMAEELARRLREAGIEPRGGHGDLGGGGARPGPGVSAADGPKVVALGGGHGLAATLQALRRVTRQLTAVVTVADDGGSSGSLRAELGGLPPGDLRQALAALGRDDEWGRPWADFVPHRFLSG